MEENTTSSGGSDEPGDLSGLDLSAYGKLIASKRRRDIEHTCPVCGRKFLGMAKSKYDRHSCAVTASRRKRKAEIATKAPDMAE